MSKKTMMLSVLVAAMMMLGTVANAQNRQFVDLTLVPQERKEALGLTMDQEVRINVLQKNYRDTFFALKGKISGLVDLKADLQRQNTLTRARDKAIMKQMNAASAKVRSERSALRVSLFHVLDHGQKLRLRAICDNEKWLRPNVKLVCYLDFNKHMAAAPEVTESKSPETLRAEAEEARRQEMEAQKAKEEQARADQARADQARAEAERQEAERQDRERQEAERQDRERQEAERYKAERHKKRHKKSRKANKRHAHRG
jgi:hypothetical protein